MKAIRPTILLLCLVAITAQAGTPDIPDEVNARLARAKSQTATEAATRARAAASFDGVAAIGTGASAGKGSTGGGVLGDGCNIAIGNVFEDKNRIGTSAKRETTVIITGDVIQVGNNCR